MGFACRIVLSLLTLSSLGAGSAMALAAERDASGTDRGPVIQATDGAGGLELRVDEAGSSIAALGGAPMTPGETRSGEFRVGTPHASSAAIVAIVTTTETHGGRDGRGCFEHRLAPVRQPAERPAAFTPYGREVVQPLHDGRTMRTWRISIRMAPSCVPTAERPVSGSLVLRLAAHG